MMKIEEIKKKHNLKGYDLANFLDMKPINFYKSTAKKRYEKAFEKFYNATNENK